MADTRILFVMINLAQSLQWESSWSVSDKIAFHSPLNFPAIFLFFLLRAELWCDWTYCVSAAAHKHGDCWSSLLLIAEHGGFRSKMRNLEHNYTYSNKMTDQSLNSLQKLFVEWQETEFLSEQDANILINSYLSFRLFPHKTVTSFMNQCFRCIFKVILTLAFNVVQVSLHRRF